MPHSKEPLLQIIHYSDIHMAGDGWLQKRWLASRHIPLEHRQGLAGARLAILDAFEDVIGGLTVRDPTWKSKPTWLVDTGDGTTFGERKALIAWDQRSTRFAQAAGKHATPLRVYGNHDAWPQVHPLGVLHAPWKMDTHRDMLRSQHFKETWPEAALAVTIPGTGSQIEMFAVNSVDHDLIVNVLALGTAARDRDWTHFQQIPRPTPAADLASRAVQHSGYRNNFRIAAMHFPVADAATSGNPSLQKVLIGRERFAAELQTDATVKPFVTHLLLAGHTHEPFPRVGSLPNHLKSAGHPPLTAGQCQIVTGSLSQEALTRPPGATGATWLKSLMFNNPYQCTVLRFYHFPQEPGKLVMERATLAADDSSQFSYLPIARNSAAWVESMDIAL
jgi:hypothetical protein